MALFDWDNPFANYTNDGSSDLTLENTSNPYNFGGSSNFTTPTKGWYDSANSQPVSTNVSDYIQKGSQVLDKLGNVIGKIAGNQSIKDVVALYASNKTAGEAKELQETLRAQATTQLQNLAQQLGTAATPDLLQYIDNAARAVSQGKVNPAEVLAAVQEKTRLAGIQVPEEFTSAVSDTLGRLDTVSKQGYTAIERAAIQRALDQVSTQTRGEQEAIKNNLQERGQWGVGSELVQRQMSQQNAANLAAQQGLDIESMGLKRALEALSAKGQLGMAAGQQSFDQQKTVAGAQDAINNFNAQLLQQAREQNAQRAQQGALVDNQNAMKIQETNVAQANLEQANALKAAQLQQENLLKQRELQAQLAASAARNSTSMWTAPYQQQLNATAAKNATANTVLNSPQQSSGSSRLSKVGKVASTIGSIASIFSDEKVKDNKKVMSDSEIEDIFNQLVPKSFTYKKTVQQAGAPAGPVVGIMAQDLERTPVGASMVVETGHGKGVDKDKALSLALAALASLNKRVSGLEGK